MFDCLIGNSDRHHSNWAIIKSLETGEVRISPVYDNGSSLCCYVNPVKISSILSNKMQFESLVYGKSKSLIGWCETKRPRHFDLFELIVENYYDECENFVIIMKNNFTDKVIDELLNQFDEDVIDKDLKVLLRRYLIERRNRMISAVAKRRGAGYE